MPHGRTRALRVPSVTGRRKAAQAARRRKPGRIAVLDRAAHVLLALAQSPRPASLNEVARLSRLSKATAFRILSALAGEGLVLHDDTTGSYRLGVLPLRLGAAVLDSMPVRAIARPFMREIRNRINETVVLSVRHGDHRYNIDFVECTNAIGPIRRIGLPVPLYTGAASKVLLAGMSTEEIDAYLQRTRLVAHSPSTITDPVRLRAELRRIRRMGWASSSAEYSPGAFAVAAAITNPARAAIAALHVSIPRGRLTEALEARCADELRYAVAAISAALAKA